jgi:RNA polymerase sigma-70 factor, ECF subfamily
MSGGQGDLGEFAALYERHIDLVRGYALSRAGCPVLAEDLASETFLRAFRRMELFRGGNLEAWLTSITRNVVNDHFRLARTRREMTVDQVHLHGVQAGPEDLAVERWETARHREQLTRMRDLMGELTEDQRRCLTLRFLEGRSIAETARTLERTEGAVKVLQHRAVRALRGRFDDAGAVAK